MIARRRWIYQAMKLAEKQRHSAELRTFRAVQKAYWEARNEHAFLLRCEGLTLQKIGDRLGVSRERVRSMLYKRARQLSWAMRRIRIFIT